jgi:hypothetical protein
VTGALALSTNCRVCSTTSASPGIRSSTACQLSQLLLRCSNCTSNLLLRVLLQVLLRQLQMSRRRRPRRLLLLLLLHHLPLRLAATL